MNKTISFAILAAVSALPPLTASAADSKLHFTGEVIASTCTVTAGANSTGSAGEIAVSLPSISKDELATDGDHAGDKAFQVLIGGVDQSDCVGGTASKASVAFDTINSSLIDQSTGRLNNSNTAGNATNVQVELVNPANGNPINVYTGTNIPDAAIVAGQAVLNLGARYVAKGGPVGEGKVDTDVAFSVVYF